MQDDYAAERDFKEVLKLDPKDRGAPRMLEAIRKEKQKRR